MDSIWLAGLDTREPADGWTFVGVIEWGSDSGEDPAVTLALTVEEVERWYRDTVANALFTPYHERERDEDTDDEQPEPPADPVEHAEIVEWMTAWREATTEAWLTVYRHQVPIA